MAKATSTRGHLWGMILYTILEDGNLSGMWTNRVKTGDARADARRQLFTEITRKDEGDVTDLAGDYRCAWIDEPAEGTVTATLHIRRNGTIYTFAWRDDATTLFTGAGMRLGPDQLVVTYWSGGATQFQLPG